VTSSLATSCASRQSLTLDKTDPSLEREASLRYGVSPTPPGQ
jgi:hypothetical protein